MNWIKEYTRNTRTHWQWYKDFFQITIFRYLITWFAVVPLLAKLLGKLPDNVVIQTAKDSIIEIEIALPFHWQLLWLSSLLFVIAFGLYKGFCPNFITKYPDFNSYLKHNHSPRWIIWESVKIIKSKIALSKFVDRLLTKSYIEEIERIETETFKPTVEENQTVLRFSHGDKSYSFALPVLTETGEISNDKTLIAEKEIFWEVFGRFSSSRYIVRFIISILLILSLLLFGWVLLENIYTGLGYFIEWL